MLFSHVWFFCDPMGCSLSGSSVHGLSQARILAWVSISFSRGSSWPGDQICISCICRQFFTTDLPGKPLVKKMKSSNIKFPGHLVVKNLPAMQEMQVRSLGWEDPPEKEMATHSSILAWRIPWTEEPVRWQSMRSQRVGHNLANNNNKTQFQSLTDEKC